MSRTAVISSVFGAYYKIRDISSPETEMQAVLRGKLRLEKNKPEFVSYRHLLMPGDRIEYSDDPGGEAVIESLLPRKNELLRATAYEVHALGGNLDRAVLIQSLCEPVPRMGFIDRFLASCHAGSVSPVLFFTKTDLAADGSSGPGAFFLPDLYRSLGYDVFQGSLLSDSPENLNTLEKFNQITENGTTLFAGNSGTGKSTLINRIFFRTMQKTNEISESTKKGRHTTTNSQLFVSENKKAFFIDTPGVKEWGIHHLNADQIYASFPEFNDAAGNCEFRNCMHSPSTRGCAIQKIIEDSDGGITEERLKSLHAMLDSLVYQDRIKKGDYIKPTGRVRQGKLKPNRD